MAGLPDASWNAWRSFSRMSQPNAVMAVRWLYTVPCQEFLLFALAMSDWRSISRVDVSEVRGRVERIEEMTYFMPARATCFLSPSVARLTRIRTRVPFFEWETNSRTSPSKPVKLASTPLVE